MLSDDTADIRDSRKPKPHWQFNIERDYERSTKRHLPAAIILLWSAIYPLVTIPPVQVIGWAAIGITVLLTIGFIYRAPVSLGMKTGFPLYILGSSTFGTTGSYFVPGLLLSFLSLGWFAFIASLVTKTILSGFDVKITFSFAVTLVWGYTMLYLGSRGFRFLSRLSLFLASISTLLLVLVLYNFGNGLTERLLQVPSNSTWLLILGAAGLFLTMAATGIDFGINKPNEPKSSSKVVARAGLCIFVLPVLFAVVLLQLFPNLVLEGRGLSVLTLLLFSLLWIPAACLSLLIAGNSLAVMLPTIKRQHSLVAGATVALFIAASKLAEHYHAFFTLIGASFGAMAGAMAADFLQAGKRWKGPRAGINIPGCAAWLFGFSVGIMPLVTSSESVRAAVLPAVFYSFLTGFVVYTALAKLKWESPLVLPDSKSTP